MGLGIDACNEGHPGSLDYGRIQGRFVPVGEVQDGRVVDPVEVWTVRLERPAPIVLGKHDHRLRGLILLPEEPKGFGAYRSARLFGEKTSRSLRADGCPDPIECVCIGRGAHVNLM